MVGFVSEYFSKQIMQQPYLADLS